MVPIEWPRRDEIFFEPSYWDLLHAKDERIKDMYISTCTQETHTSRWRSRVGVAGSPAAAIGKSQRVASCVSRGRAAARSPQPRASRPRRRRERGVEVESPCLCVSVLMWFLADARNVRIFLRNEWLLADGQHLACGRLGNASCWASLNRPTELIYLGAYMYGVRAHGIGVRGGHPACPPPGPALLPEF